MLQWKFHNKIMYLFMQSNFEIQNSIIMFYIFFYLFCCRIGKNATNIKEEEITLEDNWNVPKSSKLLSNVRLQPEVFKWRTSIYLFYFISFYFLSVLFHFIFLILFCILFCTFILFRFVLLCSVFLLYFILFYFILFYFVLF